MARYAITRTVEKTSVVALVFDKTTAEAGNVAVTLGRKFTDDRAIERATRKVVEADPNVKFIEVVDVKTQSVCLGISEEDFLAHAITLDPKTRKPIEG